MQLAAGGKTIGVPRRARDDKLRVEGCAMIGQERIGNAVGMGWIENGIVVGREGDDVLQATHEEVDERPHASPQKTGARRGAKRN